MGLRQLHTAETMFIDDGLTDGAVFPPSSNAVYDAVQNAIELPSVTAEDDGDVLTVVNGAWAKATPSGGGGGGSSNLVVTVSYDETTKTTSLDKTWQEIKNAVDAGGIVLSYVNAEGSISLCLLISLDEYTVCLFNFTQGSGLVLHADNADDYPHHTQPA